MKYLFLFLVFYPLSASAELPSFVPLGGIYYDNLNDLSAKVGLAYQYERIMKNETLDGEEVEVWQHTNFIYGDIELSENHHLLTVGWGQFRFGSNYRLGLSVGETKDNTIYGLNGTLSLLFFSFKAGVIKPRDDNAEFMIGAGIGF